MDELEEEIGLIKSHLVLGNCGFAFCNLFRSEAMAHACVRFPEVRQWWDTRINSGDRWKYGYLECQWQLVSARINCLAALSAVDLALNDCQSITG
jgi:hypothetical protein